MKRLVLILLASWLFSAYTGTFLLLIAVNGFPRAVAYIVANPIGWLIRTPVWPVMLLDGTLYHAPPIYCVIVWVLYAGAGILCQYCLSRRYRKPRPPGFCSKCGYDLRATPDRCPECGTIVGD